LAGNIVKGGKDAVLLEILSGSFVINIGREYCEKILAKGIVNNITGSFVIRIGMKHCQEILAEGIIGSIVRKLCHKDCQEALSGDISRRYYWKYCQEALSIRHNVGTVRDLLLDPYY
jgi:hypothetical protein